MKSEKLIFRLHGEKLAGLWELVRVSKPEDTPAFKLSVVEQVEKGELSYKRAQERYGIQGAVAINRPPLL